MNDKLKITEVFANLFGECEDYYMRGFKLVLLAVECLDYPTFSAMPRPTEKPVTSKISANILSRKSAKLKYREYRTSTILPIFV